MGESEIKSFKIKLDTGTANALVGGWGNSGGGVTFIVMAALYNSLVKHMPSHSAWRAAFAIVPVPVLLFVAALVFFVGTDHPAGKWQDRHNIAGAKLRSAARNSSPQWSSEENIDEKESKDQKAASADVQVHQVTTSELDVAVSEPLTLRVAARALSSPLTWLPALSYAMTFGFELAIDANMANVLFGLYPKLGQTKAGYVRGNEIPIMAVCF